MYRLLMFVAACTTPVFIVFLTLKLASAVDWSWWWVFSPILICGCLTVTAKLFRPLTAGERAARSLIDGFR